MFWNVRAMPSRLIWNGRRPTSERPPNRMSPELGRYTPVIRLNTLVLPAPFGPISDTSERLATVAERSPTAVSPPKRNVQFDKLEQRGFAHEPLRRRASHENSRGSNRPWGRVIISTMIASE